jgi:hypothetical protein
LIGGLVVACAAKAERVDPRTPVPVVTTVDGEVLGVDRVPPEQALATSVRLTVRPGSARPVVVELAPGWYLDEHGLDLRPADRVEAEGSVDAERSVFVARRIRKGASVVELRDEEGRPLWPDPKGETPAGAPPPAQ